MSRSSRKPKAAVAKKTAVRPQGRWHLANPRLQAVLRTLLVVYTALVAFPVQYHPIAPGLDSSWAFAVNYFHKQGLIFGKDVGFTYGPLAYLTVAMPVGSNLGQAIIFQLTCWFLFIALIIWLAFFRKLPLAHLAAFAVCVYAGAHTFDSFGYAGPELFVGFLALLLLSSAAVERRWYFFYGLAVVLAVLLCFIKFSSGVLALSAVMLFPLAAFLSDRRKGVYAALGAFVAAPLLFVAGFLVYDPSFGAMIGYIRLGLEISSGYSTAMSLPGYPGDLLKALLLLFFYAVFLIVLYVFRQRAFPVAFACLGPLFLTFKHAFVREPGHVSIFFAFLPLVLAVVLLRTDFTRRARPYLAVTLALLAVTWWSRNSGFLSWHSLYAGSWGLERVRVLKSVWHYSDTRRRLETVSTQNLAVDRLPAALLGRVSRASVTVFPSEAAYAAANPIDYRPFPICQTYSAYTPYLDRWEAEFLANPEKAPKFILFEWASIDGRQPLLDVPATARQMFRWYDFDSSYGARLLLRRRAVPRFGTSRPLTTEEWRRGALLRVPASRHPLIARISLNLNLAGRLKKFFFRIPEVRMAAFTAQGRFLLARVPPDVLADGIPLNFLPLDASGVRTLLQEKPVADRIQSLLLTGPGIESFEESARVEISEVPDGVVEEPPPPPNPASLHELGTVNSWQIEMLNGAGAGNVPGIVPVTAPDGYVLVRGWALDPMEKRAAGIWVVLDGKAYPATYGIPRRDISVLLRRNDTLACGFEWAFPSQGQGKKTHELEVKVLSPDGKGVYDGGRKVRFQIE